MAVARFSLVSQCPSLGVLVASMVYLLGTLGVPDAEGAVPLPDLSSSPVAPVVPVPVHLRTPRTPKHHRSSSQTSSGSSGVPDAVASGGGSGSHKAAGDNASPPCTNEALLKALSSVPASSRDSAVNSAGCAFVQGACSEPFGGGFLNYLELRYCGWQGTGALSEVFLAPGVLWDAALFLWLFALLHAVALVADVFFVPTLERVTSTLQMSENIAGITFMALGNGASDVSAILAALISGSGTDLGICEPAGAGLFV
eukprot:RCo024594